MLLWTQIGVHCDQTFLDGEFSMYFFIKKTVKDQEEPEMC